MLIKQVDDRSADISALENLLYHPDAKQSVKEKIQREIRFIQSGAKGEHDAAYEINFHYEKSKNWAIIHDLRIEDGNRSAQIDHLLINRFLDIWVCESKRFSEGIAINEHGEFEMFYGGNPSGISSPIEQNKKHIAVLDTMTHEGVITLPRRAGFSIKPSIKSLILISTNARINRPKKKFDGLDSILKVDQLKSHIDKEFDSDNNFLNIAKIISSETLKEFAEKLVSLHRPIAFNWHGRFGLASAPTVIAKQPPSFLPQAGATCPKCNQGKLECRSINRADGTETNFFACTRHPAHCTGIFPLVALTQPNKLNEIKPQTPDKPLSNQEGSPCPRCQTGKLVKRPGKQGNPPFLGCSNFPKTNCRHMENIT